MDDTTRYFISWRTNNAKATTDRRKNRRTGESTQTPQTDETHLDGTVKTRCDETEKEWRARISLKISDERMIQSVLNAERIEKLEKGATNR